MTVLLVLLTFVVLLTVDYFYSKRRALRPIIETEAAKTGIRSEVVAGFPVPENLKFHPGHTWALGESPNLVRAGLDAFAARLAGKIDRITLPTRGQWIRQGQKIITLYRNGEKAEMVSPIEGMVTDVNDGVLTNPEAARRDPYGDGWLLKVQAPDVKTSFRNLLSGALARRWMEEAAVRLRSRLPVPAGAYAQDGGVAVDDLHAAMPGRPSWAELTEEFFLT